jgi:ubiquinol oxidase
MRTSSFLISLLLLVFKLSHDVAFALIAPSQLYQKARAKNPSTIKIRRISKKAWLSPCSFLYVHKESLVAASDVDKTTAKLALDKLRERQKKDLEETERLLELLHVDNDEAIKNLSTSISAFSSAASFLAGADYGYISRSEGPPPTLKGALPSISNNYGPPSNLLTLGSQQFMRNWRAILGEYSDEPPITFSSRQMDLQKKLKLLKLNSTEIWERELADGPIEAPFVIKIPYLAICYLLDAVFEGDFVPARFFLLETVARMPYFSYISMLHLYETLGFWRRSADAKRIHFAEELNEFAHLTIMESLGGDQTWWVRFIAQHSAIFYYFLLCGLFAISPSLSYRFSELLETHAVNTYSVFLDNNEDLLKELPPTNVAVNYYSLGLSDPFYAEFQTSPIVGHEVSFFCIIFCS